MIRSALPCLVASLSPGLCAQAPHFSAADAVQAEWDRRLPELSASDLAGLPKADRARLERARIRIGQPGAPDLLPPELANPTLEIWEARAKQAKSPQERFTALHFLNRLKSAKALSALEGLTSLDARRWPKHLHLEAGVATARLNGGEPSAELRGFLKGLERAGKIDPVRAQAARLRLVLANKEQGWGPAPSWTPGAALSLLDAWNRAKDPAKVVQQTATLEGAVGQSDATSAGRQTRIPDGLPQSFPPPPKLAREGYFQRTLEGLPDPAPETAWPAVEAFLTPGTPLSIRLAATAALGKFRSEAAARIATQLGATADPLQAATLLPSLRKLNPAAADQLRNRLLEGGHPTARAAAIEDLPAAPEALETLSQRCFQDADLESALTLFQALDRWKCSLERQQAVLRPYLQHPDWAWRYHAFLQLKKGEPSLAWPEAPAPRPGDAGLLKEARRLALAGRPVRLRITFSGARSVTLKLDPTVAPINVANLKRLAERNYFDGRLVPRVVPDFVVQMGSPLDTMDGGPGYSVRCENSLQWYGPGSVGMALSGKDTGGSQFFITTNATPHLTGKYTRMGEVEDLDRALKLLDELELGARIERVEVLK